MKTINKALVDEQTLLAILTIILAIAALWAVGCGGGGAYSTPTTPSTSSSTASTSQTAATSGALTVNIVGSAGNTAFSPNPVAATAGQSVAFKNNDGTVHHLVADNGTCDSGDIVPGATSKSVSVSSTTALTFHCTIHPTLVGSINGATAPPPPTQDPSRGRDSGT